MGFLAPWFLAGAALVGIPIWLHLLQRHRTTPTPFSSLMFFEKRTQSSVQHRRLRYLLLFALRTALILLLVLAFARPFIHSTTVAKAGGGRLVILAIDNSFSMRQGNRLERAKSEAEGVLAGLHGEDRAQALSFGGQARVLGEPGSDMAAVRAAIRAIAPSDERGSYAELARVLRSIAQSSALPVEAHLFSDMQKSSLPASFMDLRLADGERLVNHAIAGQRLANFTVENVIAPRRIYDPKKVRIQATVAGFGTQRASRRVALLLNGKEIAAKSVEVPANGRGTAEFLTLDAPHGMNRGEIRIDSGDDFPADDHFNFSVERADPRPALFVHEPANTRGLLYFRAALDASGDGAFTLDPAASDQAANLALARYAFVVLSDVSLVSTPLEQALVRYTRAGGSVWIALGRAGALAKRVPVFDQAITETRYAGAEGERFQTVAFADAAHPSIGQNNRWDDVKFYQMVRVEPGQARIAARLTDGTPLLLEKQVGEGRVLVFASTFDNIANDFPVHASFVPFVDQTAHYMGRLDSRSISFTVGSFLELRSGSQQGAAAEVLDPGGARVLSLTEATKAQNIRLDREGFYDVRRPSGNHELVAVNADRHESDFEVIPRETLALWENTGQGTRAAGGAGTDEAKPVDFWWYVMIAVLAMAVVETLVGNRHLAVDKEAA
ncbi:MAG: BatA domain-containing protein [Candidatus Solibacter usitatus]|nr:BatA domain-containing protein [Candidatus Solibacter usitatus]